MNEKFKLLALEAKMGTADFDAGSYYVATPAMMQQFCELIVRECAGKVERTYLNRRRYRHRAICNSRTFWS
jgi:hypothetical protein